MLLKKLQHKPGQTIVILNEQNRVPFLPEEALLAGPVLFNPLVDGNQDLVLTFCVSRNDIDTWAPLAIQTVRPDGLLWFAYPRKSSKRYRAEINRDSGWDLLGSLGYEIVRMISIDEDWSAIRVRPVQQIRSMKRNQTLSISPEGKARTRQ